MAFNIVCMPPQRFLMHNLPKNFPQRALKPNHTCHFRCSAITQTFQDQRRSANYQPTIWTDDFVKSLKSEDMDELHKERSKELEDEVRIMIGNKGARPLTLLQLIDDVERLGLGYRFSKDITAALDRIIAMEGSNVGVEKSIHATALKFRLLRQHGYDVSQDIFRSYKDHHGDFVEDLQNDVKGLLSLYEASFLAFEGENLLEEVKSFTMIHLEDIKGYVDKSLVEKINHSLELPLHRRMCRLEARWYIDVYSKNKEANQSLLELAVLDFNMVQSTLQSDLKTVARWWKGVSLASKLNFIRDRLMECFFWTVGMIYEPSFSDCRIGLTQVTSLITTIDDIYDVYGSLDELQLFTYVVKRWDANAVKSLPHYMKLCFLALYNTVNGMAYDTLKENGINVIPILSKAWADLCQAFLVEAEWNYRKQTPTLEDYLENAWRSVSGNVILVHAYFLMSQNVTTEALEYLERHHDILKWSSMIFRLCNDLGTSTDELQRGETANSILCCMHQNGLSEKLAREHISNLISEAWKKLNKGRVDDSPFSKHYLETAMNLARISQCTYQYGDGHGAPDSRSKNRVLATIIEPIRLIK
ncbi:unnamed protein product [Ilex paraguariensis]|uniref:Uncharacterized protein n=1 Tax=Ilex paraguariensis TaxID=185542 RepID=A0ABC8UC33_9AQUA